MSTHIGKLRHRLTIQQSVRSDDSGGGATLVWTDIDEVWGAIEAISGQENLEAGRISGKVVYRITLRYRDDLAPEMRLLSGSEVFEILSVQDEDGRRRFLTCKCERRDL